MNKAVLQKKVVSIIKNNVENKTKIRPDTDLRNELNIDSFGMLMIVNAIEDEFNITINEQDFKQVNTAEDIVRELVKSGKIKQLK
jgi:acyl carrier protein